MAKSFYEIAERTRGLLERNQRVSLRGLRQEFALDENGLAALVGELCDVQQIAVRDGDVLAWAAPDPARAAAAKRPGRAARATAAERRQLTVLFCDLVDSTSLASGLDVEDWRDVVGAYQDAAARVVERFEGHVAQHLGDGLLVYFGWPAAHEDDAERAVRAGLGIVLAVHERNRELAARYRVRLAVRVGIHTGPVVVGDVGGGERRETLALGDTTHVAARIQAEAPPDAVVVSAATLRLVRGGFVTEDLGTRRFKGVAKPRHVHHVLRPVASGSPLSRAAGRLTRFVGRVQELGVLLDRFEQALEGEGQTVFVSGELGLGKSRLALALRERLAGQDHTWLECRCSAYTVGSALYPLGELLAQGIGVSERDTPDAKRRALEAGLARAGLVPHESAPLVAELLALSAESGELPLQIAPAERRERTLATLLSFFLSLAGDHPLVLLIEDLHWADPSTVEWIGRLLERMPGARALLLLTARPEFELRWRDAPGFSLLELRPLRRRPSRELVEALRGEGALPEKVVEAIVERGAGVPLFLEELARPALDAEGDAREVAVPETLQDSLMAQLDRLAAAKPLAQLASPLGREFSHRLLAAVAELDPAALRDGLQRLVHADVLIARGEPPDCSYSFRHALIQDTAYESLLKSRRQTLHARIANVLQQDFPELARSQPERVAHHRSEAGEVRAAVECWEQAGQRCTERSAHEEAIAHFERGLELAQRLPDPGERTEAELRLQVALAVPLQAARGYGAPEVERALERARALVEQVGEPERLFPVLAGLSASHLLRARLESARELAAGLRQMAERSGDPHLFAWASYSLCLPHVYMGRFAEALAIAEAGMNASAGAVRGALGTLYSGDPGIDCRVQAAIIRWALGFPDRAVAEIDEALRLAREAGLLITQASARVMAAILAQLRREPAQAAQHAQAAVELATQESFPFWKGMGEVVLGWAIAAQGSPGEGIARIESGFSIYGSTGAELGSTYVGALLADARRRAGQTEDALAQLDVALALAEKTGERFAQAELLRMKGEVLAEEGALARSESYLRRALEIARAQRARSFELRAAATLARLLGRTDRAGEGRDLLAAARQGLEEGFDTIDGKEASALWKELAS